MLLEYLLWSEDQHNMVESVRTGPGCGTHKPTEPRQKSAIEPSNSQAVGTSGD
jgi:hypothetical protein